MPPELPGDFIFSAECGCASGDFELNVFRPMIAHNFLHSLNDHCAIGIEPHRARIAELVARRDNVAVARRVFRECAK